MTKKRKELETDTEDLTVVEKMWEEFSIDAESKQKLADYAFVRLMRNFDAENRKRILKKRRDNMAKRAASLKAVRELIGFYDYCDDDIKKDK